jgi:hypothetical protein
MSFTLLLLRVPHNQCLFVSFFNLHALKPHELTFSCANGLKGGFVA